MLVWILNFFRGYVSVLLHGHFIERFINVCTNRNIYLWDIRKSTPTDAGMKMSIRGFRQIRPVARKTHTRVRIRKKHGFPILMHRYRKRYFFFAGVLLFMLFVFGMSQFVWSIEVAGNERVPTQQILDTLAQLGFKEGTFRPGVDVVDLKNNALLQLDALSWLWVDLRGSKAFVSVQEKTPPPVIVPKDQPCDIIAVKAGVIKLVNAKAGKAAVAPGETVQEGQLLVSGVVTSQNPEIPHRYEHALGEVYARTWYDQSGQYAPTREVHTFTGKQKKHRSMKIFGKKINFYINGNAPYENCDKVTDESELKLGQHHYLGITWITDVYKQYDVSHEPVPLEENLSIAQKALEEKILSQVGDGAQEVARRFDHTVAEDGTVNASLTIEFTEQIGMPKQITSQIPAQSPPPAKQPGQ